MKPLVVLALVILAPPAFATGELEPGADVAAPPPGSEAQAAEAPGEGQRSADAPPQPAQERTEQAEQPADAPQASPAGQARAEPAETAEPEPEPAPAGRVARAAFTTAVVDREPTATVDRLTTDSGEVLFFTELVGLNGQTVAHRWEFQGEVVAEVEFDVGGPRWRVHSSKQLQPGWTGRWTVHVVDGAGRVLHSAAFDYVPAPASTESKPEAEPAGAVPVPAAPEDGAAEDGAAEDSAEPDAFRPAGAPQPE